MKAITIKINISGREYPVNVTADTESLMQKAADAVNEQVEKYALTYSVGDRRDLLAMCALQLAFQNLEKNHADRKSLTQIENKVQAIEADLGLL